MKIRTHKRFKKQYKKLNPKLKKKTKETLLLFSKNPHHKSLRNHSLSGRLKGKRSISVSDDLRIIFEEFENYTLVIFLNIGTHGRIYRD